MRVPDERLPFRDQRDLDAFEALHLLSLGADYNLKSRDVKMLMLAIRIYAGAYHELVLCGRVEPIDCESICEHADVTHQTLEAARVLVDRIGVEGGMLKENDKGGYDYVDPTERKGRK